MSGVGLRYVDVENNRKRWKEWGGDLEGIGIRRISIIGTKRLFISFVTVCFPSWQRRGRCLFFFSFRSFGGPPVMELVMLIQFGGMALGNQPG